ncbi:hypothetical protein ACYPKM_04955 [Pseudomonas aeruginosa]
MNNIMPNQHTTWAGLSSTVEEYLDWQLRKVDTRYASDRVEILAYIVDQIVSEGEAIVGHPSAHPIMGLMNHITQKAPRLAELLYARAAIVHANDFGPANRLIAGQRLTLGLPDDYVTRTQCYSSQSNMTCSEIDTDLESKVAGEPNLGKSENPFAMGNEKNLKKLIDVMGPRQGLISRLIRKLTIPRRKLG